MFPRFLNLLLGKLEHDKLTLSCSGIPLLSSFVLLDTNPVTSKWLAIAALAAAISGIILNSLKTIHEWKNMRYDIEAHKAERKKKNHKSDVKNEIIKDEVKNDVNKTEFDEFNTIEG